MQPSGWTTVGTATATHCQHAVPIQTATNDRGETVTRTDAYPDPDATPYQYDAPQLCADCYRAKMDRKTAGMTFDDMCAAWSGKRRSTTRR